MTDIVSAYHYVIHLFFLYSGMTDTLLHIHVGLAIFLGAWLIFRGPRAIYIALAILTVLIAHNEISDRIYYREWRVADTAKDVINTLFWPIAIVGVTAFRERRAARDRARTVMEPAPIAAPPAPAADNVVALGGMRDKETGSDDAVTGSTAAPDRRLLQD